MAPLSYWKNCTIPLLLLLDYLTKDYFQSRLPPPTVPNPLHPHCHLSNQHCHPRNLPTPPCSSPRRPHDDLRAPRPRRPRHNVREAGRPVLPARRLHPARWLLAPARQIRDAVIRSSHLRRRARLQNQTREGNDEFLPAHPALAARRSKQLFYTSRRPARLVDLHWL